MFLAAVVAALRQEGLRELHQHWTSLLVSCLPCLGPALTTVVTSTAQQLWANLESLSETAGAVVPSDYVLGVLEALGHLLSYCLLDSAPGGSVTTGGPSFPSSPSQPPTPSILQSLAHVLGAAEGAKGGESRAEQLASARRALLSLTPRLLVSLCSLWRSLQGPGQPSWLLGSPRAVRNTVLELLSPLATVHSSHFLAAVAVAWAEQGEEGGGRQVLVELVSSLRMFPTPTLIATLRQVVKSPPPVSGLPPGTSLHLAALQYFSSHLLHSPATGLAELWPCLRELLRDCCSLPPPSLLLALSLLHQFVVRGGARELEKREVREVQELTGRLVEGAAGIAGSRLEAGTWLRGSRGVREEAEPQVCNACV